MSAEKHKSLDALNRDLEAARPASRIGYRDDVLDYGAACIEPLTALALRSTDLTASVAAWLEALAARGAVNYVERPSGTSRTRRAGSDARYATESLRRLGGAAEGPPRMKRTGGPKAPSAKFLEVRAQVHQAAREGRILHYEDLRTNRAFYGKWLKDISDEEMAADHPPISAIVVRKGSERPGPGFYQLCRERNFARPGEADEDMWERAVAAVFGFWRDQA